MKSVKCRRVIEEKRPRVCTRCKRVFPRYGRSATCGRSETIDTPSSAFYSYLVSNELTNTSTDTMYLTDGLTDSSSYDSRSHHDSKQWSVRYPPAPPTSIPLDDRFDAMTTEVPTEWNIGSVQHRDYEESVSGYRNYVEDIERKLSGEDDYYVPSGKLYDNVKRSSLMYNGSMRSKPSGGRKHSQSVSMLMPENMRKISGNRGKIELVEQKVMEDNPQRTISIWRERVAQSSGGSSSRYSDEMRSDTHSQMHHRAVSDDIRARRMTIHGYAGNNDNVALPGSNVREIEVRKSGKSTYERSEYMVTYHPPSRGGIPMAFYAQSEAEIAIPLAGNGGYSKSSNAMARKISPDRSISSGNRRSSGRRSNERDEYMVSYIQAPPHGGASSGSSAGPKAQKIPVHASMSSMQRKTFTTPHPTDASSVTKATFASSVELILSSCDPSLLHIAPILSELGIHRLEHLRAIARLSDGTRDREIKEQALKRGVTVVEWAILLDMLQSL